MFHENKLENAEIEITIYGEAQANDVLTRLGVFYQAFQKSRPHSLFACKRLDLPQNVLSLASLYIKLAMLDKICLLFFLGQRKPHINPWRFQHIPTLLSI